MAENSDCGEFWDGYDSDRDKEYVPSSKFRKQKKIT